MRQTAEATENIEKYSTGPRQLLPMQKAIQSAQQQMLPAVQSISLKLYKSSSDVSVSVSWMSLFVFPDKLPSRAPGTNDACAAPAADTLCARASDCYFLPGGSSSFAAILTNSASDSACIFRITCPRWIFTVISLVPSSKPICLLSMPETTKLRTSRSRAVSNW